MTLKTIGLATLISVMIAAPTAYAAGGERMEKRMEKRMERMQQKLNLSETQMTQLRSLTEAHMATMKAQREAHKSQIQSILTPDQQAKMAEIKSKRGKKGMFKRLRGEKCEP